MMWICSFKPVITVLPWEIMGESQAFGASSYWERLQDRAMQSLGFRDLQGGLMSGVDSRSSSVDMD